MNPKKMPMIKQMSEMIANGATINKTAKALGIQKMTFFARLNDTPEFQEAYARAKECLADKLAQDVLEAAYAPLPDDIDKQLVNAHVQNKRLMIDTLKWVASKYKPKSYGDRVDVDVTGHVTVSPLAQLRQLGAETEQPVIDVDPVTDDDCF
jgi:hypothetical protein